MEITIDIDNPLPQFEQLIEQIKAAVTAGKLKPGDALPSIRQLANDLDLNSKTVAKGYKLLERDSIIEAKGYRGTYVHPKAKANCKFNLQEWTLRKLSETIAELRESGVTDSEIRNAFADAINRRPPMKRGSHDRSLFVSGDVPGADPGNVRVVPGPVYPVHSNKSEERARGASCGAVSGRGRRRSPRALSRPISRSELDRCSDRLVAAGLVHSLHAKPALGRRGGGRLDYRVLFAPMFSHHAECLE